MKERLDGWRNDLTKREIELFEFYSAELLELLGYVPDYGRAALPPAFSERLQMAIAARRKFARDFIVQRLRRP